MGNGIALYTISKLLDKNFFIPSYQRGYRWENQQVSDLLDDIYSFAIKKNKTEEEFYCLQPIVVKRCNTKIIEENALQSEFDDNNWYEVIDGQQRLTTIRILLTYLVREHLGGQTLYTEYGKHEFILEYETRYKTTEFLNNITDSKDNIDFYFISQAYDSISLWFEKYKSKRAIRENILRTLISDMDNKEAEGVVQVIWYELEQDINPIDSFIRINMGKIQLTNAELIKALFLQKRNFGDNEVAKLKQIEIASEWDKIEFSLQNDDFWWFLNKSKNDVPSRIEFLFDLIFNIDMPNKKKKKELEEFENLYGTDKHATFRFFNKKFSGHINYQKVEEEWNVVKEYFLAFEEWFSNPIWYHYIGFLIYSGNSIVDIYHLFQGKKKNIFTNALQHKIKEKFKNIECKKFKKEKDISYKINLSFKDKKETIREFLLLLNIQFIVRQYEKIKEHSDNEISMKFPFKLFKEEAGWDVEHIDSFTENPIKDKKTQDEWLETASNDLKEKLSELPTIKNKIKIFIKDNKAKNFEELRNTIVEAADEVANDIEAKNSIGNLTLLDAGTNRSYGNSLFPTKRRTIIERDMEGKFIPICTKNVFLKYFDKKGTLRTKWSNDDINNYQNFIGDVLYQFLNTDGVEHEQI